MKNIFIVCLISIFMCSGCAVMMSASSPSEKPHISKISHYNKYQLDALYDCNFLKQIDTNILIKEYNWETGHPSYIKYCRVAGHAVLDFCSCFIWEIIGTPMELAFIATYDNYSYYVIFKNDKIIKIFDSTKYNISDVEKWINNYGNRAEQALIQ